METQDNRTNLHLIMKLSPYKDNIAMYQADEHGEEGECIFYKQCTEEEFEIWEELSHKMAAIESMIQALTDAKEAFTTLDLDSLPPNAIPPIHKAVVSIDKASQKLTYTPKS